MKIYQQRTAVLNQYPTDELLEIFTLVKFMRGIFAEVADDQPNIQEILLSTGPAGAVRIWEDRSYDGVEDDLLPSGLLYGDVDFPLFDRFFSRAFENIWAARRLKPPSGDGGSAQATTSSSASDSTSPAAMWLKYVEDQPTSKWILDSVIGGNDTCSQCATPGGLNLLTQANWSRLMMNPQPLLKGKLKDNRHTCNQFSGAWVARMNNSNTGAWIEELFEMSSASAVVNVVGSAGGAGTSTSGGASTSTSSGAASAPVGGTSATANSSTSTLAPAAAPAPTLAPATLKALAHSSFAPFAGWEVDMSYCESCLCRFIEQHTWVWWLEQELKSGWTPPEDCWYGYNCNTQTHRPLHAQGKNHMCVPTRGPA
ncbi:hypothetical protein C8R43DRAFT_1019552 [Mycena crocata]|nr:hypothetical protein C8R43DRAFT_1019552 [Mycena crocata]